MYFQRCVLFVNKRARNALVSYNAVNSRIFTAKFRGAPHNLAVVQVAAKEEIERFYEDLQKVLNELPNKDVNIIIGDWNAKVGAGNNGYVDNV